MLQDSVLGERARWERERPSVGQRDERAEWALESRPPAGRRPRSGRTDAARRAAGPVGAVARYLSADLDRGRLWLAAVVGFLGLLLASSAGLADAYFHRGIGSGNEGAVVLHPTGRELATNADLTIIQPAQLEGVVEQLQLAGFRFVRQSFAWSAIEARPGAFDWSRYDPIVDALAERGITVVAVLHRSPEWARPLESQGFPDAPPADFAAFAAFVAEFARHYSSQRVPFVQVWDRPNAPDQWGGVAAEAGDYGALLAAAAAAIDGAEPAIQNILAELEPFPPGGTGDLDFLRGIYRAGVGESFDIVAATVDGGGRSPFDRVVRANRLNLSRAVLLREVMEDAGDDQTPIWATHFGWSAGDGQGQVQAPRQAAFNVDGIQRARREWPWMGPLFMWGFLPLPTDTWAPYALLTTDGKSTELFGAISRFSRELGSEAAPTGFAPVNARSLNYEGRWNDQVLPPQVYRTTSALGATVTISFRGSGLIAYLRQGPDAGSIGMTLDGEAIGDLDEDTLSSFQALNVPVELVSDLDDGIHALTLTLTEEGEFTIGGVVVVRERPFLWPVVLLAVAAAMLIFLAMREVVYVVATRTGHLKRRRAYDPWRSGGRRTVLAPRLSR